MAMAMVLETKKTIGKKKLIYSQFPQNLTKTTSTLLAAAQEPSPGTPPGGNPPLSLERVFSWGFGAGSSIFG